MTNVELDLPDFFCAMFLFTHLPHNFFSFCSIVSQTVAPNDFTVNTIIHRIHSEIDLCSTGQSLRSCISNVENEPMSHHFANKTNMV